ncbi:MAG: mevalonate kinase [Chloroflexota bacterium]
MIQATAPGKLILFGEHAVVYGRPGIAVPVLDVTAHARFIPGPDLVVHALDLGEVIKIKDEPEHPLSIAVKSTSRYLKKDTPSGQIEIQSSIPLSSGLGSGTAVNVAVIKAMAMAMGEIIAPEHVSEIAYEIEKIHHGTPSGIDNTVIAYQSPIFFTSGECEVLSIASSFILVIAVSGIRIPTSKTVLDVRHNWRRDTTKYESLFDEIGHLSFVARRCMLDGDLIELGRLMLQNHHLLQEIGVSSSTLDRFVNVAVEHGAYGAKLTGAGRGGCVVALCQPSSIKALEQDFLEEGAERVIVSEINR